MASLALCACRAYCSRVRAGLWKGQSGTESRQRIATSCRGPGQPVAHCCEMVSRLLGDPGQQAVLRRRPQGAATFDFPNVAISSRVGACCVRGHAAALPSDPWSAGCSVQAWRHPPPPILLLRRQQRRHLQQAGFLPSLHIDPGGAGDCDSLSTNGRVATSVSLLIHHATVQSSTCRRTSSVRCVGRLLSILCCTLYEHSC